MKQFFLCALVAASTLCFAPRAFSQACGAPVVLPGGSDFLYSSVFDRPYSRYLAYRRGQTVTIAEVSREGGLHVIPKFSIPTPPSTSVSVGFTDGEVAISFSRILAPQPTNETPEELSWIHYYRLADGSYDSTRSFRAGSVDLLPVKGSTAPFYTSNWPFSSWHDALCNATQAVRAQQGRVMAAAGSKLFMVNNAEQVNACNEDPLYYLYHLNQFGEPTTPILPSEHCPGCPYWWYQLDPGGLMRSGAQSPTRFYFPTDINSPDGEDLIAPNRVRFGAVTGMRVDPTDGGFAMTVDMDPIGFPVRNTGGILFYDAQGNYRGFGSTFAHNGRLGETGAIASLGARSTGEIIYAAGTGRNVPAGGGGFNIPAQFQTEFRPEGGHVGYFYPNGESFQLDFGDHANDNFGAALAPLGDINLDREPDLVVGAPGGNYASVISVIADETSGGRGIMYRFQGPANSQFGKQVATLSTAQNGRADVVAVAANDAIRLYDIGNCLTNATPVLGLRETLRRVIPQAKAALVPIPPRKADRNSRTRMVLDMHPALQTFFFKFAAVADALHTSNDTIPSNEEVRASELEASYFILNISLNNRDKSMLLLKDITPALNAAAARCPRSQRARGRSQACKQYRKLAARAATYNSSIAATRAEITRMKDIQNRNYDEILAELP
ncbi:MAG: hypothetical protein J0M12_13895 [Deltaproteobacteria bacterium]|nr:hypothetical protein [Deltaproteobacteria bacterium]